MSKDAQMKGSGMNMQFSAKTGPALRVSEKSADLDSLTIEQIDADVPEPGPGQVLVEVKAAGVNPSDVKASLGHMPHAVWPRIPGRDFSGVVRKGPEKFIGMEIWGGGGELGITQNGTHSRWLILNQTAVRAKPKNLTFEEAGAIGVPFITAFEGLREAGGVQPWDSVMVCGANGKVGQAAIQLATLAGAQVFGVEYKPGDFIGHKNGDVDMLDSSSQDVADYVREKTEGRGVDVVFNTVGSPYFEIANKAMAKQGREIFISTFDRAVDFDIFQFFRGRHRYIGVDSLALDTSYGAKIFERLRPLFERGALKPFPINPDAIHALDDAVSAYQRVLRSTPDRIILKP
jgi:NADPH2:quinone reductase